MKRLILAVLLLSSPALAQQQEQTPEIATLVQLLREAQQREMAAVYRAVVAERKATVAETKTETPKP